MKIDELQPGDVLFTMLNRKPPALHTQLYLADAQFPATILHAVDGGKASKLMATSLPKDVKDLLVYRCKGRPELIGKAVKFASRWTMYQTPYDQERKNLKEGYRNILDSEGVKADAIPQRMRELFNRHGKFRAIKYASRRRGILCYPGEDGTSRGLTCTMFVILCYQVAAIAEHVRKTHQLGLGGSASVRVSDKKLQPSDEAILKSLVTKGRLDAQDLRDYIEYVRTIQSGNEYSIDWELAYREPSTRPASPRRPGFQYFPSLLCWDGPPSMHAFDFAAAMTPAFMVDSKITTSEQLRLCIEADGEHWEAGVYLDADQEVPADPKYKEKLQQQSDWAQNLRDGYAPKPQLRVQKP
jgi:hypothetical protein